MAEGTCTIALVAAIFILSTLINDVTSVKYVVHKDKLSHDKAVKSCKAKGGKLAQPESPMEQDALVETLKKHNGSNKFFWIGIKLIGNEFEYMDGEGLQLLAWRPNKNQPNKMKKCVEMIMSVNEYNRGWSTNKCSTAGQYICEMPGAPNQPVGEITFSDVTDDGATVRWPTAETPGIPVTGYQLEISTSDHFAEPITTKVAADPTFARVNGLTVGHKYAVWVRALSKDDKSKPLRSRHYLVPLPRPAQVDPRFWQNRVEL